MKNYISRLRLKVGNDKIIQPAARIIVENDDGNVLIVSKHPDGKLALPAGAFEDGESIRECVIREVYEETGITLLDLQVIGISTRPEYETIYYRNGDVVQYFTVEFYSNKWEGDIEVHDTTEIISAAFMDKRNLQLIPENEKSAVESLQYFRDNGMIMLK